MMAVRAANKGEGVAQRVLMIMLGVLLPAFIGFLIWLATSVVEIKVGVAETKRDVAGLLEARRTDTDQRARRNAEKIQDNSERIQELKQAVEK